MKKGKIIGLIIIMIIFLVLFLILLKHFNYPKNTIGNIAYNKTKKEEVVYLLEDNKLTPYVVLTNHYNNNSDTLLLRKNVIGDENYYIDYNGSIIPEKIYNGALKMNNTQYYQDTEVDYFLLNIFPKKFEKKLLKIIKNTKLSISLYNNGKYDNTKISRQFFLLSFLELNTTNSWQNKSTNKTKLNYFKLNSNRIAKNDAGIIVTYWTRTYATNGFGAIGLNGGIITETSTEAKYGIRPALTIDSKTKIKKTYSEKFNQDIWILDI